MKSILGIVLFLLATVASAHEGSIEVRSVVPDGPAARAGVLTGDALVAIGGRPIDELATLQAVLAQSEPGDVVSLTVERGGARVELSLTLGEKPEGGVSVGVTLALSASMTSTSMASTNTASTSTAGGEATSTSGTEDMKPVACLPWIEETYGISAAKSSASEVARDFEAIEACVARDSGGSELIPLRYCDNIFKIHCGGVDLLGEIAEDRLDRCERRLGPSLGSDSSERDAWARCARERLYDGFTMDAEPIDQATCRATFEACSSK